MTLEPGQTGHFSLIYLPGTSASTDITVSKLVITPPNAYTQAELTWNQSVVLRTARPTLGTYITPVVALSPSSPGALPSLSGMTRRSVTAVREG